MKRIIIAVVSLLMGAGAASAQTADTKLCDILAHPKDFNGKMVRVTGTVVAGFDEFIVRDTSCKQSVNGLWLDFPIGTTAKAASCRDHASVGKEQPRASVVGFSGAGNAGHGRGLEEIRLVAIRVSKNIGAVPRMCSFDCDGHIDWTT